MKMIILAAGKGTRLRPLTNKKPKCMVEYQNKPIIDYILNVAKDSNIDNVGIVTGYKSNVLEKHLSKQNIKFYNNENYANTNMVSSLFCAKDFMNDDLIISYSDIIYKKEVLDILIQSKNEFSVIIDKNWHQLWSQRMENPLDDAETLKIKNGKIIEIGKKPKNYDEIEGQYIGLIKISKKILPLVIDYYRGLDTSQIYDNKDFNNMYMTTFIQKIIDNLLYVSPIYIHGGWTEIDTVNDLQIKF